MRHDRSPYTFTSREATKTIRRTGQAVYYDIIGPQSRPVLVLAESAARRCAAKARLLESLAAAGKLA